MVPFCSKRSAHAGCCRAPQILFLRVAGVIRSRQPIQSGPLQEHRASPSTWPFAMQTMTTRPGFHQWPSRCSTSVPSQCQDVSSWFLPKQTNQLTNQPPPTTTTNNNQQQPQQRKDCNLRCGFWATLAPSPPSGLRKCLAINDPWDSLEQLTEACQRPRQTSTAQSQSLPSASFRTFSSSSQEPPPIHPIATWRVKRRWPASCAGKSPSAAFGRPRPAVRFGPRESQSSGRRWVPLREWM